MNEQAQGWCLNEMRNKILNYTQSKVFCSAQYDDRHCLMHLHKVMGEQELF